MPAQLTFDEFKEGWLDDITKDNPSTVELGRRFAWKMFTQWQDVPENSEENLVFCDGAGDGGIDIAFLSRKDDDPLNLNNATDGDTWYLVQSKYGKAFQGPSTLFTESQKLLDTLEGKRNNLSSLAQGLRTQLTTFLAQASEQDKLILVFATNEALNEGQRTTLDGIRAIGRDRLGPVFDVEAVSISTIYAQAIDEPQTRLITVPISLNDKLQKDELWVGPVSLMAIYDFMKKYRSQTEDLNRLYDKNVRRFLGNQKAINKGIQNTLRNTPEHFGLYNNGITIVVNGFQESADCTNLVDPYIVNGCQTTRCIWEVFHQYLEAGGTGVSDTLEDWKKRAERGVVVTKIVRVTPGNTAMLNNTIKFTNSQNAIRDKDFLALRNEFKRWQTEMADHYGIFLEIQRGGWDARSAFQKQHPAVKPQFKENAYAFDLIKVYAAAWLGEAGTAWSNNSAFLPSGSMFSKIVDGVTDDKPFGVDDLFAAYQLQTVADTYKFGRGAKQDSRKLTRYLYYMIFGELLRDVMVKHGIKTSERNMTEAVIKLFLPDNKEVAKKLTDIAVNVIDDYMTQGLENSIYNEAVFQNTFGNNMNAYLKWEAVGKDDRSLQFRTLLKTYKTVFGMAEPHGSKGDQVALAIR